MYTAVGGAVELPAYLLGGPIVRKAGRRLTIAVTLLITGTAILVPLAVTHGTQYIEPPAVIHGTHSTHY